MAVLVRQGITARAADLPKMEHDGPLAHELRQFYRWLHVLVGYGSGSTCLHVQPLYGHSSHPVENGTLLTKALAYSARLGTSPQAIGGFNFPLGDLQGVLGPNLAAVLTRRLVDAHRDLAHGGPSLC